MRRRVGIVVASGRAKVCVVMLVWSVCLGGKEEERGRIDAAKEGGGSFVVQKMPGQVSDWRER